MLVEDEIRTGFDPRPELRKAALFAEKLDRIINEFASPTWATAAQARKAELYDACWTRIHPAPPEAETAMLRFYIEAVVSAKQLKVWSPPIERAARRLASLTEALGDARLRAVSQGIIDRATKIPFVYKDGMFARARPGMTALDTATLTPSPLPVIP